ncbi:N-acyl-D-amino-acid deacylase [Prescottella sp. R16]|uniref:N-acyl-D-amino-acid deacylase n=1 Tax=Prescottella sp. R16 TaxID=3064529 RepID=UPI00272ED2A7|nr:N-acyl-D-amino-acid deacylase [Prescottella sp. R16]
MADEVTIDIPRVRAVGHTFREGSGVLDTAARAVASGGFAATPSGAVDPARERAIRDGYLRLAHAIGAWSAASSLTGRTLTDTADAYLRQDTGTAGTVAALGGR